MTPLQNTIATITVGAMALTVVLMLFFLVRTSPGWDRGRVVLVGLGVMAVLQLAFRLWIRTIH